jgi:membrane-associated phospholipid phosphatase
VQAPTDPSPDHPTLEEAVADRLAESPTPRRSRAERMLRDLGRIDTAVYRAIADTPAPELDHPLRRLSNAANRSALWIVIAVGLALFGGRKGRRAAAAGLASIGAASAVVNLGLKSLYRRPRPDREGAGVEEDRHVSMPGSTSFPSGHSASGVAFATTVGALLPVLALPLRLLAAAVAYSRVHTGVHYPGDALAGSLVGGTVGLVVGRTVLRRSAGRRSSHTEAGTTPES